MDSDIPGMKKGRIEHALQKEGYETVTFYNVDGSMGYRPDDSFFDGKAALSSQTQQLESGDHHPA